jgi:hypothetical protein
MPGKPARTIYRLMPDQASVHGVMGPLSEFRDALSEI